jgi:hypothetical protein
MKAGRKCKKGRREPNGRIQRSALPYQDVMAVALAQPHRRGSKEPLLESPLGQFVLRQELPRVCYDTALNYAGLVRRIYAVAGIPQPVHTGYHPVGEREMTTEVARALQHQLQQVERRLSGISCAGLSALRSLAVHEREALLQQEAEGSWILLELAADSQKSGPLLPFRATYSPARYRVGPFFIASLNPARRARCVL